MIDSGLEMDGDWELEGIPGLASKKGIVGHACTLGLHFFCFAELNMFLITQHLVIHIEVVFVFHFLLYFFS
jgi:hypothetical protein